MSGEQVFVPSLEVGWAAAILVLGYAMVRFAISRFGRQDFWMARLQSVPVELVGFFIFGWARSKSWQIGLAAAIIGTVVVEVLIVVSLYPPRERHTTDPRG